MINIRKKENDPSFCFPFSPLPFLRVPWFCVLSGAKVLETENQTEREERERERVVRVCVCVCMHACVCLCVCVCA